MRDVHRDFVRGHYQEALAQLEKSAIREQTRNRLLYYLEKAAILDHLGERAKSRNLLLEADKIADQLYTVSISKTAASFIVSDSVTDYSGEDYELVAIHTMLALSFIKDNDLKAARVEAAKINNKLHEINNRYQDKKNRYAVDAFALVLSGSIYEAREEWDDAIIDYTKALELYENGYTQFCCSSAPDSLILGMYRVLKKRNRLDRISVLEKKFGKVIKSIKQDEQALPEAGELIGIHGVGHIARKETREFFLPISGQVIRFSFPVIPRPNYNVYGQTGITIIDSSENFYSGYKAQDMNAIAHFTLDDKRLRMVIKQGARLLAKGQITEQAYKYLGPLGGIAANVASAVTETADTRSWILLPAAFFLTRVRLKPGSYSVQSWNDGRRSLISKISIGRDQTILVSEH